MTLNVSPHSATGLTLEFSPAVSARARVTAVTVNGRPAKFDVKKNATDQHVKIAVPLAQPSTIRIHVLNDFQLMLRPQLPPLGAASRNMKVVSEWWDPSSSEVTYDIAGIAGNSYDIPVRGSAGASVEGGRLISSGASATLRVAIPGHSPEYGHVRVTFHFSRAQ
jgi:hypothetical protein